MMGVFIVPDIYIYIYIHMPGIMGEEKIKSGSSRIGACLFYLDLPRFNLKKQYI
jgi:hypothetical protein